MKGVEKITADHRRRNVFIYARQSTMAQVLLHRTSTERQFGLTQLAMKLGWSEEQVKLVAGDLGCSGKFSENRDGFQHLAAEVSLGRVGAVFSLEASRLARSSADWSRLIEIAGLTRTLLVDQDSVYDPCDPNDRLVLGLKGTMAEFELVWLRQRMDGGRWHLAHKGEYRVRPPVGYVWEDHQLVKDPDEEIRRAVELLFERYRVASSCGDILRYFAERNILFPSRFGARVEWRRLHPQRAAEALRNPIYAGAYAFGRTRTETFLDEGLRRCRVRKRPMEEWPILIHDAHPAYISWEEYLSNQKRLSDSGAVHKNSTTRGSPRKGAALLQGILLCGRCSHRILTRYTGTRGRYPQYHCQRLCESGVYNKCLSVSCRQVDEPVVELVMQTLTREHLDAATRVVTLIKQEDAAVEQQWKLRLERARYEATRAQRQYDACEPENRVVARTLETRWNEKLTELERLEQEHEQMRRKRRIELTDLDRQRILALAEDIPKLWRADTTTDRDRKALLRLLIEDVSVQAIDIPRPVLRIQVLWHTQAVTELEVDRPGRGGPHRPIPWRIVSTTTPRLDENVTT
jgi:DNA invertase Pin-like site-specific DNA recombinase